MKWLDNTALVIVIIGAVNWLLVGIFQFDLVAFLFGNLSWLSRIIYTLVGLCGLYLISFFGRIGNSASIRMSCAERKFAKHNSSTRPLNLFIILSTFIFLNIHLYITKYAPLFTQRFRNIIFFLQAGKFRFQFCSNLLHPFFTIQIMHFCRVLLQIIKFPLVIHIKMHQFIALHLDTVMCTDTMKTGEFIIVIVK